MNVASWTMEKYRFFNIKQALHHADLAVVDDEDDTVNIVLAGDNDVCYYSCFCHDLRVDNGGLHDLWLSYRTLHTIKKISLNMSLFKNM
jgi:hypothetical protein